MKNLVTSMVIGAIVGGAIGSIANDDMMRFKKMMMKKGKKIARMF